MKKVDFLVISKNEEVIKKCESISNDFNYLFAALPDVDTFSEREAEFNTANFILLTTENFQKDSDIAGAVQVLKQFCPSGFLLVTVSSKLDPAVGVFVKRSGANAVLMDLELVTTSKLEFIASQKIKASFLPIKAEELFEGSSLDFFLYHLMPMNRKFLPVIRPNEAITKSKLDKIKEVREVFVRREDLEKYIKYASLYEEKTQASFDRRCRAKFLILMKSYVDLLMLLSDQSEHASFKEGEALYKKCKDLADDLLGALGSAEDSWKIVNNTAMGGFGSAERSPAVAAYAALLSIKSGVGKPDDALMGALLCDLGLLFMSPSVSRKIRTGSELKNAHKEDFEEFQKHPLVSLNVVLSRKIQVSEDLKQVILCTHERVDRSGFPHQPRPEKIPMESMIIQFCEMVDQRSLIQLGKERPDIRQITQDIFSEQAMKNQVFSGFFMELIKNHI